MWVEVYEVETIKYVGVAKELEEEEMNIVASQAILLHLT